ncbi:MAG: aconitate hydratase AcnA, partial [Deltaproteobacteria bacterium]|nr:aconitate hydratase AcnA [Deltaproteobacteria bacterium]
QDFTGVPAVADLAAMRVAADQFYGDPLKVNPKIPAELVIDHSVQVDSFGQPESFERNSKIEFDRNFERYAFLRWGQESFSNFSVVPPATGICHQINLEYLARVVFLNTENGGKTAYPDTLVGLDSHTTMINGAGVLGWGVGGIEAEAVLLGRPYYMLTPQVVGFQLSKNLSKGVTATDLVLTITEILRQKGVVGKFVEFFGSGLKGLSLEDRATIANMAPEYGATMGFFPVDEKTLDYLRLTGRSETAVGLVSDYCKTQGLFRTDSAPDPVFSDIVELDLASVEPSMAGPYRPQERIALSNMKKAFSDSLDKARDTDVPIKEISLTLDGKTHSFGDGAVVIAAITSCTNTSNPSVLIGAGLLAKKAVDKGLSVQPWVKTSLAPGSKAVMTYLKKAGLLSYLETLNFHCVAYGCTTCIGNSGPLPEPIATKIQKHDLIVASVLSGNRNFEGRINPLTRVNFLASPPLVVAYAIAGRMDIDFEEEPIGSDSDGNSVYLRDIWPDDKEINRIVETTIEPEMFQTVYESVFEGSEQWKSLPLTKEQLYDWDSESTYIKEPPFLKNISQEPSKIAGIKNARVLALLGDTVTTDHISPAGAIPEDSPAGKYLIDNGIAPSDFNSFGSRRGNHEVMMRGTFGNIRLDNKLVPGVFGWHTIYLPRDEKMPIYDAAMEYEKENIPLLVIAGKEYGTGSSRDWAAKGTALLGVKAVIAQSFERIHRSNLICMGVLPLQFLSGENQESLGLDGTETFDINGIEDMNGPGEKLTIIAKKADGSSVSFEVISRIDTPTELSYFQHGGILPYVLRNLK